MLIHTLQEQNLIHPPKFLADNTHLLVAMGSTAYGCSTNDSDLDCYGFCIPPRPEVFPHLDGEIQGFGTVKQRFNQWSEHHVKTPDGKKEYDFTIYSIVKFFQLCMENNPNMVDALFVPRRCVLHTTKVGEFVRENRRVFLTKRSFHKFRGYAFAQMSKIDKQKPSNPERAALVEKFGFDTKFAYHVVRLALEGEQILTEGDLDLERNSAVLNSIRRGEWKLDDIKQWFTEKERALERLYNETTVVPYAPDEEEIKRLLVSAMEMHYGSLGEAVRLEQPPVEKLVGELQALVEKYKVAA